VSESELKNFVDEPRTQSRRSFVGDVDNATHLSQLAAIPVSDGGPLPRWVRAPLQLFLVLTTSAMLFSPWYLISYLVQPVVSDALGSAAGLEMDVFKNRTGSSNAEFNYDSVPGTILMVLPMGPLRWIIAPIGTLLVAVVLKWAVIFRFRPGRYHVWSAYFMRWWLVTEGIMDAFPVVFAVRLFRETSILSLFYRLCGCKMGSFDVFINPDRAINPLKEFDLLTIGAGSLIEPGAIVMGHDFQGGMLVLGQVKIGEDCRIGSKAVLLPGATLCDGSELLPMSVLSGAEGAVPKGQVFGGQPAHACPAIATGALPEAMRSWTLMLWKVVGLIICSWVIELPLTLSVTLLNMLTGAIDTDLDINFMLGLFVVPIPAALGIFILLWALHRLAMGRTRAGRHHASPFLLARVWLVDTLMLGPTFQFISIMLDHSTTFIWCARALGVKIGKRCFLEHDVVFRAGLDLVSFGDDVFMGADNFLPTYTLEGDCIHFRPMAIDDNVIIANTIVLVPGSHLESRVTIGNLTAGTHHLLGETTATIISHDDKESQQQPPPTIMVDGCCMCVTVAVDQSPAGIGDFVCRYEAGTSWVGCTQIGMDASIEQNEQVTKGMQANWRGLEAASAEKIGTAHYVQAGMMVMFTQLTLPIVAAVIGILTFLITNSIPDIDGVDGSSLRSGVALASLILLLMLVTILLKRFVFGNFRGRTPYWSYKFTSWQLLGKLMILTDDFLIWAIKGTPMMCAWIRAMGGKVGKDVYWTGVNPVEADLVDVGDGCILHECALIPHVVDHQMLQWGVIKLEDGATLGCLAQVMALGKVGKFAEVAPLSLVAKGEELPAHTHWVGNPVMRAD